MAKRIVILAVLLGLFGIVCWNRIMPRVQERRKAKQEAIQAEKRIAEEAKPYRKDRILEGGSLNILPPEKSPVGQDPAVLVGKSEWRQRYRPFLERTQGQVPRVRAAVYPFLDNSRDGVGVFFTYGWRLVGSAALSQWSNADVACFAFPKEFGIPLLDENNPERVFTKEEWNARALADPATAECRIVITGYYETGPSGNLRLTVVALDRESPSAAPRVLFAGARPLRGEFVDLAKEQRDAARAMVDKLIQAKIVQPRAPAQPAGIAMDVELGEIARLLDTNDTWGVMEGIDRALQLAILFPKETAPLQAAAYGMNVLNWFVFNYVFESQYAIDYGLRAFALAQVALQMDWVPDTSMVNLLCGCVPLKLELDAVIQSYPNNGIPMPRELIAYEDATRNTYDQHIPMDKIPALPDWLVLRYETGQTWFVGQSQNRAFFTECLKRWKDCDLFVYAYVRSQTYSHYYSKSSEDGFVTYRRASAVATQATLASELAFLLTALRGEQTDAKLLDIASALTRLDKEHLKILAENGDYYAIRRAVLGAIESWDAPEYPNHPAYFLLGKMAEAAAQVYRTEELSRAASGYSGFEFTPAERVLLAQRRDFLGPIIAVIQQKAIYGSMEGMLGLAQLYLSVRGDSSEVHKRLCEYANEYLAASPEMLKTCMTEAETSYRMFPLAPDRHYRLARIGYYNRNEDVGELYLRQYERLNPFSYTLYMDMGDLYRRYRHHAKAVRCYDKFLKQYPKRYDVGIERARSLCEMGRWNEAQVREAFEVPVRELPGNVHFHTARLDYLIVWAKDYEAARQAGLFYLQHKGGKLMGPYKYLSVIEEKTGNPDKALEWIQKIPVENYLEGSYPPQIYAGVARYYLDLDRPDLAEPWVAKAARADSWQAAAIIVMAELAEAKGNYQEALAHYRRLQERYARNTSAIKAIGECLMKMGEKEEAIRYLEPEYYPGDLPHGHTFLAPLLINLYVQTNQPDKARKAVEHLLQSEERTRNGILTCLEHYEKINPEHAAEIRQNLDGLMTGPED